MSQIGGMMGLGLQETVHRERGGARTILEFLSEGMDDLDQAEKRKSLKERLGLKGMGCCGATWGLGPSSISVEEDGGGQSQQHLERMEARDVGQNPTENNSDPDCVGQLPAVSRLNLASERHLRPAQYSNGMGTVSPITPIDNGPNLVTATPLRVSLMRLLEESDGLDGEMEKEERGVECDSMCCECMRRKKGTAFIPCGHTFCRVCSRELWSSRGSCPLCNRLILQILDIF